VALEPNPAAANDAVTHPHVSGGVLWAGDAAAAIGRALEEGRLADAFCLVRSVLTHYNPASPHVPLEDWAGQDCHECGCNARADDLSPCACCGCDLCEDCLGCCAGCRAGRCQQCLERCPSCEESYCPGCLGRSASSDKACCHTCLRVCAACGAAVAPDELDLQTRFGPCCVPDDMEPEQPSAPGDGTLPIPQAFPTETVHEPPNPPVSVP
jgi:hypothetical protein